MSSVYSWSFGLRIRRAGQQDVAAFILSEPLEHKSGPALRLNAHFALFYPLFMHKVTLMVQERAREVQATS